MLYNDNFTPSSSPPGLDLSDCGARESGDDAGSTRDPDGGAAPGSTGKAQKLRHHGCQQTVRAIREDWIVKTTNNVLYELLGSLNIDIVAFGFRYLAPSLSPSASTRTSPRFHIQLPRAVALLALQFRRVRAPRRYTCGSPGPEHLQRPYKGMDSD